MIHPEHANHRPITIFRAGSFLTRAQGKEIEGYFQMSKMSIGSYWEGANSTKVGTGLTFAEQNLLMPYIINCEADEKGFRSQVENYFHEIDTKVPYNTGMVLETGLSEDNNRPVSKTNLPLDINDYIRWRQVRGHPQVAYNKKESDGNPLKLYYIFDPADMQRTNKRVIEDKDTAMQTYLELKKQPEKIDMVLTLMGEDIRSFTGPDKDDLKIQRLKELSEDEKDDKYKLFVEVAKKDHISIRYWLENMVILEVLSKVGTKYIDIVNKKVIGNNVEEAIAYFNDAENSNAVVMLKARMQEAQKKPLIPGFRKTVVKA